MQFVRMSVCLSIRNISTPGYNLRIHGILLFIIYLSPPQGRMNIHTTINMCEQKYISEQY